MMKRYVVVAGSNLPDSREMVGRAMEFIGNKWKILRKSSVYSTPDFLGSGTEYDNVVIEFEAQESADEIENFLKLYERQQGRTPERKLVGEVPIDIDIVLCDGRILREKDFDTKYFKTGYSQL